MTSTEMLDDGLNSLTESVPVGLFSLKRTREVFALNPRAESLLGSSGAILRGRHLTQIIYHDSPLFDLLDRAEDLMGEVYAQSLQIAGPQCGPLTVTVRVQFDPIEQMFFAAIAPYKIASQSEETASLAGLARILGHEIKNPLAGLSGAAQLLLRQAREDQVQLLELIEKETDRIRRMIDRVTVFETYSAPRPRRMNLHEILDTVVKLESVAHNTVDFECFYDPSLPDIDGDPDHLHEAFQNLIRNATEAARAEPNPHVRIRTRYQAGVRLLSREKGSLASALAVFVEDNGPGIPNSVGERIFDPFFTTKSHGTGVGLPLVKDIITAHNGRISHERTAKMTRFEVLLPLPTPNRKS